VKKLIATGKGGELEVHPHSTTELLGKKKKISSTSSIGEGVGGEIRNKQN